MYISTFVTLSVSASAALAAAISRQGLKVRGTSGPGNMLGAFYFMTNDPSQNLVVASQINADGTLLPVNAVATGGAGGSGTVDPPAAEHADSLFTQDSVKVSKNMLFAVNAGSNTLSMFNINENDPTQLTLAAQASTGGDFPTSVGVSNDGTMACALNSGSQSNFMCFSVENNNLVAMPDTQRCLGVNQTAVPAGPGGTVSDLVFMNDGNIAVSVKGTSATAPGNVQLFSVTGSGKTAQVGNAATVIPAAKGGALPFSLSVPLDGSNALFATDAAAGVSTFDFSSAKDPAGNASAATAATSTLTPISGQGATCWSAQSPVTGSFFVSDVLTSQLTEFAIDKGTGAATEVQAFPMSNSTGTIDLNVASTKAGDFLYVNGAGTQSLIAMAVGTAPGQAKMIQNLDLQSTIGGQINLSKSIQGAAVYVMS
jgi:hypothetical protein